MMESILKMNFYAWEWLDCSIAHVSMQIRNDVNILQIEESIVQLQSVTDFNIDIWLVQYYLFTVSRFQLTKCC